MRNKNVCMCGIGALAFMLIVRFIMSGEMDTPPDFCNNEAWYDIKLLTDGSDDNCRSVKSNNYGNSMKEVLQELLIMTNKRLHFGRKHGTIVLEYDELSSDDIKELGNWNPTIQQQRYSTKLPLRPIRSMAGFPPGQTHYNPRTQVDVPDVLLEQVFPWVDGELERVHQRCAEDGIDRQTAVEFLKLLKHLRIVAFQDAAYMLAFSLDRCEGHPMFKLPCFSNPVFLVSISSC